jgi:hypothetical protein
MNQQEIQQQVDNAFKRLVETTIDAKLNAFFETVQSNVEKMMHTNRTRFAVMSSSGYGTSSVSLPANEKLSEYADAKIRVTHLDEVIEHDARRKGYSGIDELIEKDVRA